MRNTESFDRHAGESVRAVYALLANIRIAFGFMNRDMFKGIYVCDLNLNIMCLCIAPI